MHLRCIFSKRPMGLYKQINNKSPGSDVSGSTRLPRMQRNQLRGSFVGSRRRQRNDAGDLGFLCWARIGCCLGREHRETAASQTIQMAKNGIDSPVHRVARLISRVEGDFDIDDAYIFASHGLSPRHAARWWLLLSMYPGNLGNICMTFGHVPCADHSLSRRGWQGVRKQRRANNTLL
jgi:hypothetical protein